MGETPTQVVLIECNIDDMTGEALGFALERILDAGALDAWFTPIQMKKCRPGTMLSVLCHPQDAEMLINTILCETTTLGVRRQLVDRTVAQRKIDIVNTPWGPVRMKQKYVGERPVSTKPEFEDCAALARENGLALQTVQQAAIEALSQQHD